MPGCFFLVGVQPADLARWIYALAQRPIQTSPTPRACTGGEGWDVIELVMTTSVTEAAGLRAAVARSPRPARRPALRFDFLNNLPTVKSGSILFQAIPITPTERQSHLPPMRNPGFVHIFPQETARSRPCETPQCWSPDYHQSNHPCIMKTLERLVIPRSPCRAPIHPAAERTTPPRNKFPRRHDRHVADQFLQPRSFSGQIPKDA